MNRVLLPRSRAIATLLPLIALLAAFAQAGPIESVPESLVFASGVDALASRSSEFAALRNRNFSNANGANGTVYIGIQSNLGGGGPRGTNQSVPWTRQIYDFTYTYDPVQKMAATTWTGRTSGTTNVSYQPLATIPAIPANEMSLHVRNTGPADLILTLSRINSVGRGGVLSGSLGGTIVTGGTVLFTDATWNGAGNAFRQAFLIDDTLFNQGFQLFGSVTVGSTPSSANYGNNEGSRFEINLRNTPSSMPIVPEPSTSVLVLGGLALGGWQMSRRRRASR